MPCASTISRTSVHPHACGDDQRTQSHLAQSVRFTPTRVGTTNQRIGHLAIRSVHPHACGDDPTSPLTTTSTHGSPPRVWGRLLSECLSHIASRFTPTRVGTTKIRPGCRHQDAVHPHACGDDARFLRSRGDGDRFTPTRVGTTIGGLRRAPPSSVHPHACGDDFWGDLAPLPRDGSPPRVWGRPILPAQSLRSLRFTPTRVGTTSTSPRRRLTPTVHPHACGDDMDKEFLQRYLDGSPPRVWGRLSISKIYPFFFRFTPTRVGTTCVRVLVQRRRTVHPHACGDDRS